MDEEERKPHEKISEDSKFCVDCGAQIHARAEICPSCGIRQPALIAPAEEVSNWWYALPLCIGIIGGILGWLGVRNRDSEKARNMLIIGVFSNIVTWILL